MAEGAETLSSAISGSRPDAVLFGLQPLLTKTEAVAATLQLRSDYPDLALIVLAYELGRKVPFDLLSQLTSGCVHQRPNTPGNTHWVVRQKCRQHLGKFRPFSPAI